MSSRTAARIAVLMGGRSAEREVSLGSGRECAAALRQRDSRSSRSTPAPTSRRCWPRAPDVAFNALHGRWGEDGCVQGILEWLRHPLHPFRRAGLGAGHGQDPGEADLRRRRPAGRARHDRLPRAHPRRAPDGAALRGQAQRRGLLGRRLHRAARAPTGPPQLADDMPEPVLVEEYVAGRELTDGGDGRRGARRHRHHRRGLVRLPRQVRPRRLAPRGPGRPAGRDHRGLPRLRAPRPPGARLPRAQPHRLPLGRDARPRRALSARDQHPAGDDPDLARPRAGGARGISFGALVRWMVEDASCSR